jgi:phospholipid/cholesterol/gamma-HCH transport system substrate-binding protein
VKRENVNYFLAGVVALGALGLLLGTLFVITGRSGPTDDYVVRYRNVAGLAFGTPVFFQGFRIGQIEGITPERQADATRFRVDFSVQNGWQIPKDSEAQLMSSGLLSDVFISIREGEEQSFLEPGAEIKGREAADLFGAVGELAGEVTTLTRDKLTPLVERLGQRLDSIGGKFEEGTPLLIDKAVELVDQLNTSAASLNKILGPANQGHIDALLSESSAAATNVRQLTHDFAATRQQLDSILSELDGTVKESRPEIQQGIADLRFTLDAMAQRIDAITYNLESASRHFDEFSRQIRKEPNRLIFAPQADKLPEEKR